MRDIRYALRTLARSMGLSLAAVVVLALGIGANSAIFTVVRAVLLAPLPYPEPERLVRLYERDVVGTNPYNVASAQNFFDWRSEARSFSSMGFYGDWGSSLSPSDGGLPENLTGAICDAGFFGTLGTQPRLGRVFREEDDRQDAERVVVIGHALWQRRFAGSPEAIGASVRLDGELHKVIGVMPAGFDYPSAVAQVWLPVSRMLKPNYRHMRGNHRFSVVARLKPGTSLEQARAELDGIARRIHAQYPESVTGKGANVALLAERMVSNVRPLLLVLLGAVVCVLLIACVNVGNLLLARAVAVRREVAIRAALGAGRWRIARQFLVESLLLALGGAGLGMLLAIFGTDVLIGMAGNIPRIESVRVDGAVLAFTGVVAALTGLAAGMAPALMCSAASLTMTMQEGGRSATAGRGRKIFRDTMVAIEVALSLMLLAGAGLMLKSFTRLRAVDPGFVPDRILTLRFGLPPQRYTKPALVAGFYRDLLDRARNIPGVESAGLVTVAPLAGHQMDNVFTVDGRAPLPPGQFLDAVVRAADPGYFKAAGIRLLRGRVFRDADWLETADKTVISERMATMFFPNEDPIGKRIRLTPKQSYEIVGIVGDARQNLASAAEPTMYFPLYAGDITFATLVVRAAGDPNPLSLPIQKQMRGMDADLPAVTVRTMDEMMSGSTQQNRFGLTLIGLFAVLAVTLASIGLYGVLAYSVGQRTNEIGVRMALGADSRSITGLIVRQGLTPALGGIAVGIGGSLAGGRLLKTMLYDATPSDPAVLGAVAALLAAITLAACLAPARRAIKIDPAAALRGD
jgi:predicted permease